MSSNKIIEEYYIVFHGAIKKHWVQSFLHPEFYHCFAFKLSPGGQFYQVINATRSHTDVDLIDANPDNFELLTKDRKFVRIICSIDPSVDRGGFCRFNCVEMVKSLIGVKSFFTFTPKQLYRRLKNG